MSCGVPLNSGARKGIESAIEQARERQEKQAEARLASSFRDDSKAGASGLKQIGQRPQEQGGNGGNQDNKAQEKDA